MLHYLRRILCKVLLLITAVFGLQLKSRANQPIESFSVAATTFSIQPKVGMLASHTRVGVLVDAVYGDLKTTLTLFKQENNTMLLISSPLGVDSYLREPIVKAIQEVLKLPKDAIVTASSHNHTVPHLLVDANQVPPKNTPQYLSWEVGTDFMGKLKKAAEGLTAKLVPVTVEWGVAEENRISYNRRGVYPDGTTYFMREEDRQLVGEGYVGTIDPDAAVVVFRNRNTGKPVTALTMFACHPVVAYNPEKQFSFGQFPQIASEMVSDYFGGIPVGFLQGASGDINAKYMLTGTIDQAKEAGRILGETMLIAARNLRPSKRIGMEWSIETAYIPYGPLPSLEDLELSLAEIDDFVKRGNAGDENTLRCVGMNFPRALTPPYRANLVMGVRDWYIWAIEQYKQNKLNDLPTHMTMRFVVARFGDVGYAAMPYEMFVKTGLKIKRESTLPLVLVGGYTNGAYGYIPNSSAVDDREYMSGYFRYRKSIPPYAAPAADAAAEVAIRKLNQFAR